MVASAAIVPSAVLPRLFNDFSNALLNSTWCVARCVGRSRCAFSDKVLLRLLPDLLIRNYQYYSKFAMLAQSPSENRTASSAKLSKIITSCRRRASSNFVQARSFLRLPIYPRLTHVAAWLCPIDFRPTARYDTPTLLRCRPLAAWRMRWIVGDSR